MQDLPQADGQVIADKIARLQADELEHFFRDHLRRRDLHRVVANLNTAALDQAVPGAAQARAALKRLGFTD